MPRFSKCPPSETLTNLLRSSATANVSRIKYHRLNGSQLLDHESRPGFGNHQASRTLNIVSRNATSGEVSYPMLGLAAAPETDIARPSSTPPAKLLLSDGFLVGA